MLVNLNAQRTLTITGKVKDSLTGALVRGVTISDPTQKFIVQTEDNGGFVITVSPTDTLLISHINYLGKIVIANQLQHQSIILLLPKSIELQEITINTGYQQLKPNEVNGSYSVIDNRTLNLQTTTNILDRLNGVTSSLLVNMGKKNNNPQNSTKISIRGLSTINGPLDPLIVVDNFIYEGDINNINPNDVENITVLKDAAAASIWGARAGNGVIVITTKKGRFNQRLQVGVTSSVTIAEKPNLFHSRQISSSDFIDFEQALFNRGFFKRLLNSELYPAVSPGVLIFDMRKRGVITYEDSAKLIDALKQNDSRRQFDKYYYQPGFTQQHGLNLRGGNKDIAWFISGAYDKSISSLKGVNDRINLSFKNFYRPLQNLNLNVGVYYTTNSSRTGFAEYSELSTISGRYIPYLSLTGPNGESIPVVKGYNSNFKDTVGSRYLLNWNYYPLEDYKHNNTQTKREELLANIGLNWQVLSYLGVQMQLQYQRQNNVASNLADTSSYYSRDLINTFTDLSNVPRIITRAVPIGGILRREYISLNSYNARGQINFGRTFIRNHVATAIAGIELRAAHSASDNVIMYGYNRDPLAYSASMDYISSFPMIFPGYFQNIQGPSQVTAFDNRFVSLFANGSYSFKGLYSISGSLRKDGSNIFGANTNDKWKPLWSAGFGWNLAKEPFYDVSWLPWLRLSVTYGVSGNVDASKTAKPVATAYVQDVTGLPAQAIRVINNPELSWEKSYQTNLKLDFGMLEQRITGSLEYYMKRGVDLYGPMVYDYTSWGVSGTITANASSMKGRGVDISLHSENVNTAVKWSTDFLCSYNSSKTTKYYSDNINPMAILGSGAGIRPIIGLPLYAIGAFRWGGLDASGNPRGYLSDTLSTDYIALADALMRNPDQTGFKFIGTSSPKYFGSLLNTFRFKNFSVSANFNFRVGYYLLKPSLSYMSLANSGISGIDYDKRWQQPGDESKTTVPSYVYPVRAYRDAFYNSSEINVIKGDHLRLQFVNLTYDFKWKKYPSSSLQLFINCANLGIIWRANNDHIDPDFVSAIPAPRTNTIGIRANF